MIDLIKVLLSDLDFHLFLESLLLNRHGFFSFYLFFVEFALLLHSDIVADSRGEILLGR